MDVSYYKSESGKEYLVATYRKMIFESVNINDEDDASLMVGDVLNATTYVAYRFYNFDKDDWYDTYEQGFLDEYLDTEEEKKLYIENMYGQYFIDLSDYVETVSGINATVKDDGIPKLSDGRKPELWSRIPSTEDVYLQNIGLDYQIVSQAAGQYGGNAVFVYLVDVNGDSSSTQDRDIFMVTYNFEEDYVTPPTRLTNCKDYYK